MSIKPILFNTEMVRAILDGRKTCTRRVVKYKYSNTEIKLRTDKYGTRLVEIQKDKEGETYGRNEDGSTWHKLLAMIEKEPPYKKGDILYVRETWNICNMDIEKPTITFIYKADKNEAESALTVKVSDEIYEKYEASMAENNSDWRPSIHMPKEAARIWLRVKDVRTERINEMSIQDMINEGINTDGIITTAGPITYRVINRFEELWDSTVKEEQYKFASNPYVWVIEFERCEKPQEGE